MKHILSFMLLAFPIFPAAIAQQNVGIGGAATRARLEVFGAPGVSNTSAVFGSDGTGISFQKNWPAVGFNQYKDSTGGSTRYMGIGYAAIQSFDPANGIWALDMQATSGSKDGMMAMAPYRAFTIFSNGTVSFGKGFNNSGLIVDYLNYGGLNTADGSIYFYGTQHPSFINASAPVGMPTQIGPGKDGGVTFINDPPNTKTVIGAGSGKLGINTNPLYLTTLSIRHPVHGGGFRLIDQNTANNWEWYVSADDPVWIGQKYNGLLIGDYNPTNGVHGYVSDRRLKTATRPLGPVLEKLVQLQPVEYHMKAETPGAAPSQGFVAQEVKKFFPELVSIIGSNHSGPKGLPDLHMLNYSQFFVLAIQAIQEQQAELAALNKELSSLEKKHP